jgi:hypothetical protein
MIGSGGAIGLFRADFFFFFPFFLFLPAERFVVL